MKEVVEAVYENGVLRPLRRLAVEDGRRVRLTVEAEQQDNIHSPDEARSVYDFSDLAGRLKWRGDALEEQRRIRDEWR